MKPFQQARNGSGAILVLHQHYLGTNNVNNMTSESKAMLNNTKYHREKKCCNFESYVSLMKEQHQILHHLEEHGPYGMDEGSKVRILNLGIQTDKLNNVKTQILANPALQNDFNACVTLYKYFISQTKSDGNDMLNISQVKTYDDPRKGKYKNQTWQKGKSVKRKRDGADKDNVNIEDRYYNAKEYGKMTPGKREHLKKLHSGRDRQASAVLTDLASLKVQLSKLTAAKEDRDANESGNRSNPALVKSKSGHGRQDRE